MIYGSEMIFLSKKLANNIKMDLREIVSDGMDWIDLAEGRDQ
jgi:hypothetical protein